MPLVRTSDRESTPLGVLAQTCLQLALRSLPHWYVEGVGLFHAAAWNVNVWIRSSEALELARRENMLESLRALACVLSSGDEDRSQYMRNLGHLTRGEAVETCQAADGSLRCTLHHEHFGMHWDAIRHQSFAGTAPAVEGQVRDG